MGLILALDQGGTKTVALAATGRGEILGVGYGRGACHSSAGMDVAMAAVREAMAAALAGAGATAAEVERVCGGMAGADYPHEFPLLTEGLRAVTGVHPVTVVNDCIIARRAGTDSPWGAVLCAGTGLNAAVISPRGETFVFGDYIGGEDQGGSALGRHAVRAAFNAEAGLGPPTLLTASLLAHFQLNTVDEMLFQYVTGRLGPTSVLMPLLVSAVRAGDAVAARVVTDFGERLARYITAGLRRFAMTGLEVDVVLSGGIFKAGLPELRETVSHSIRQGAGRARILDARYEPVVGALLLAMDVPARLDLPALAESAGRHHLVRKWS